MKRLIFILSIVCLHGLTLHSQIQFKSSNETLVEGSFTMGFSDVNGDYRDDVIIQGSGRTVNLFIQTENKGMHLAKTMALPGDNDWSLAVLDANNDGKKEIISSGAYNGTYLIEFDNTVDFSYDIENIESGIIFAQNANAADINNDGFLDYFVCHDDGDSHMYMNDGTGNFSKDNSMFDFVTSPVSDGSGNYGSIWADIDGDDDLDLYIAKCRGFSNSTTDPRRINQLHINNGDGTFTDQAPAFGLASGEQTWAADFADADNDGDLDCFMVQHTGDYMFFENVDSTFIPRPDYISLPISGVGFQGFFSDLDNDGLVDIIIAGDADFILWNRGDLNFITEENPINGSFELASLALGDANSDGFTDILGSYNIGFGVGNQFSEIWLNEGNDNNHVSVSLRGVNSNREGVGSKVRVYSALGTQIRNVTSGEGYGIVNSLTQRYGLAQDQLIDSLEVLWPSGHRDMFYDLDVNQHYFITEGDCISTIENNKYEDFIDSFCSGESTSINADQTLDWNTGESTNELQVFNSGFYNADLPENSNCNSAFATVVIEEQLQEIGTVLYETQYACRGESIVLSANVENVNWSNGSQSNEITVTQSGNYSFTANGNCSDIYSDTLSVEFYDPGTVEDQYIETAQGDNLDIQVEGENIYWYTLDNLLSPFHQGNNLIIQDIQESVEYRVENVLEIIIEGVMINTDTPGTRRIEVMDENAMVVFSKDVDITDIGEQFIQLDCNLAKGNDYYITTNEFVNISNLGMPSPRITRSRDVVGYPFVAGDLLEITNSNFGPGYYYYFYNWIVSTPTIDCASEQAKIEINVETVGVNDPDFLQDLSVYPIPAHDKLEIRTNNTILSSAELFDLQGRLVLMQNISGTSALIDLDDVIDGIYVLKIKSQSGKNAILKLPRINR